MRRWLQWETRQSHPQITQIVFYEICVICGLVPGETMEATLRQTWAFLFRGYHITRRYIGWVIVFNFYALVTSATVALIGVAQGDYQLTLKLVVGALLWN